MPIRPRNVDRATGGLVLGTPLGSSLKEPEWLDAEDLLTIINSEGQAGSGYMFVQQLVPGQTPDLYPTDFVGNTSSGDLFNESVLRTASLTYIDWVVCYFNSSGVDLTLKDANGDAIVPDIDFVTPMPQPFSLRLGIPVPVVGGFTASADAAVGGGFMIGFRVLETTT